MISHHPDIDSHGFAAQTVRIQNLDGTHPGAIHVMHIDGKPMCMLRNVKVVPGESEWKPLGHARVTCGHCMNNMISTEVSGRISRGGGGWSGGTSGGDVQLNAPKDFERADEDERRRRMARKLPLDLPRP